MLSGWVGVGIEKRILFGHVRGEKQVDSWEWNSGARDQAHIAMFISWTAAHES